jgi:hypothetical protein
MAIKPLSAQQAKLMRLILNSAASDGEALNALSKLRHSLAKTGPDPHELVDALENAGFAEKEQAPLPPEPSKPDYGLCKIPFGKNKNQLFMDTPPYELRRLREWILTKSPETAVRFAEVVHDIEAYLGPQACR